jgi:glycosyltransferase involved in cell wall biosynthesis
VNKIFTKSEVKNLQAKIDELKDQVDMSTGNKLKICIVTQDFSGPILNGGIGTIYTSLARMLANHDMEVTVLFTLGPRSERQGFDHWIRVYAKENITLVPMPAPEVGNTNTAPPLQRAYAVYEWLKDKEFDFVHSPDWMGQLFYCVQAKEEGLAFANTCFVVGCHGPSLWNWQGNRQIPDNFMVFTFNDMERRCAESTDYLISSSYHLVEWMQSEGWQIDKNKTFVQPNIFTNPCDPISAYQPGKTINEIVFCGRLEFRKGIHIFCDAINQIKDKLDKKTKITIIGKPIERKDFKSLDFINGKFKDLDLELKIYTDFDSQKLLRYFETGDRLAVIASTGDNSPITITEFLNYDIPFIASTTGGLPELIHEEDWDRVLFPATAKGLSDKLIEVFDRDMHMPSAAIPTEESNRMWIEWHKTVGRNKPYAKETKTAEQYSITSKDITVCLVHHDRPAELELAITALENQTIKGFSVIVVDDGSTGKDTLEFLEKLEGRLEKNGWILLRQENSYAGAARNNAARNASSDYLLFMDDDNVAKPNEIEVMLIAVNNSDADVLTCFADVFEGNWRGNEVKPLRRLIFSGGMTSNSLWTNTIGDANLIIRKADFIGLEGFHEKFGTGYEDYHFLVRAVLNGLKVNVIPEPLYWYKISRNRVRKKHYSVDDARLMILDAYLEKLPVELRSTLYSAYSRSFSNNKGFEIRSGGRVIAQDGVHTPKWVKKFYRSQRKVFDTLIVAQQKVVNLEVRAFEWFIHFQASIFMHGRELVKKIKG